MIFGLYYFWCCFGSPMVVTQHKQHGLPLSRPAEGEVLLPHWTHLYFLTFFELRQKGAPIWKSELQWLPLGSPTNWYDCWISPCMSINTPWNIIPFSLLKNLRKWYKSVIFTVITVSCLLVVYSTYRDLNILFFFLLKYLKHAFKLEVEPPKSSVIKSWQIFIF